MILKVSINPSHDVEILGPLLVDVSEECISVSLDVGLNHSFEILLVASVLRVCLACLQEDILLKVNPPWHLVLDDDISFAEHGLIKIGRAVKYLLGRAEISQGLVYLQLCEEFLNTFEGNSSQLGAIHIQVELVLLSAIKWVLPSGRVEIQDIWICLPDNLEYDIRCEHVGLTPDPTIVRGEVIEPSYTSLEYVQSCDILNVFPL